MNKFKIIFLLLLAMMLVSSCATRSWDSRVACAAAGAIAGAGVGGVADDSKGALAGAAIGGLLGFIICPSSAAEPESEPAPGDADGDGVTDDKDRCPGTPSGAKVDANGCELDSDGDGVVDSKDACPGTPAGVKVDANGCEIKAKAISLTGILFRTDSAELKSESIAVLNANR